MMKRFTKFTSLLLTAFVVCWGSGVMAQTTCATAIPAFLCTTHTGSTVGVANDTGSSGAGVCAVGSAGQHWYTFTAGSTATHTISFCGGGTTYDSWISVYTGTCGAFACVGFNDDFCGLQSQFSWAATAGTTYYLRVGGFSSSSGAYSFNISTAGTVCGCTDAGACNFNPSATVDNGTCCYGSCVTLQMNDSFGDGWNGATLTLEEVSTGITQSFTLASGASGTATACLNTGCYLIDVSSGSFPGEVSWTLSGFTGGPISGGAPVQDLLFGVGGAVCVFGCTDVFATNYNPSATLDDGSCVYCPPGEGLVVINMFDSFGDGWNGANYLLVDEVGNIIAQGSLNTADFGNTFSAGYDVFCLPVGCYFMIVTAGSFPQEITWNVSDAGGNVIVSGGAPATLVGFDFGGVGGCTIYGCTDPNCNNYNSFATNDDGSCECPPANDDCADATDVTCGSSVTGTFEFANDDNGEILDNCGVGVGSGVWYHIVGTGDQINVTTCNSVPVVDTQIHVFDGTCGSLNCIAANDDACGLGSNLTFTSVNGTNYWILVDPFGGTGTADFQLDITCNECLNPPQPNDENAGALLQLSGVTFTQNLCCVNPDNSVCLGFQTGYGVWFYMNACAGVCGLADTFDFILNNLTGANIGMTVYEDLDGDGIAEDAEAIACCPIVTETCAGDISAFYTLTACNDFYFLVYTTDPINCGDFDFTTTLGYLGCTDPNACNYTGDPCINIDDFSCEYTSCAFVPDNDLCGDATFLPCDTSLDGTTGGATNTDFAGICGGGGGVVGLDCAQSGYILTGDDCETAVCAIDPFCCNVFWDGICAGEALSFPTECGDCIGAGGGIGVWYQLPVGNGDTYTVSTCGSTTDTGLQIYQGTCGAFTNCTGSESSDFVNCGFFDQDDAQIEFISGVGVQYYVYVMPEGPSGAFTITLTCDPTILGCTSPAACNYDPAANWDDGSCDFFSCVCDGPGTPVQLNMFDLFGDGWDNGTYTITDSNGDVVASGSCDDADFVVDNDNFVGCESAFDMLCLQDGCYTITVGGSIFNGEIQWNIEDENGNILAAGGSPATVDFSIGGQCGCTDNTACNFDPAAVVDDGSCCFGVCATVNMFDSFGDGWNGAVYSFTDSNGNVVATGFLATGTFGSDDLCLPDGCYIFEVTAGVFPGEVSWNITDENGNILASGGAPTEITFSAGGVCGCTDPNACNFDPDATVDNGTCCLDNCSTLILTDTFGDGWDNGIYVITSLSDGSIVTSGTLASGSLGTASLCLASGCYNISVGGSFNNNEIGYILVGADQPVSGGSPSNQNFSIGGSNCTPTCQEPMACNFDATGGINDCTLCEYTSCLGCTYACADNYDPAATIDDGTCTGCDNPCPADLDGNGVVNVSDLLIFMGAFGTFCD